MISEVIPKTPAATAGLKGTYRDRLGRIHLGDIIVAVNGKPIGNYDSLYNTLSKMQVGDDITLTVIRGKRKITHNMKTIDIGSF